MSCSCIEYIDGHQGKIGARCTRDFRKRLCLQAGPCQSNRAELCLDSTEAQPFRFVDPKGKKAKKVAAAATSTGFDDKGMPVVFDWHYAMAELSRKNGVPVLCQSAFGGDMLTAYLDAETP